jgi:tetratricopeptide (TPR) repeat protein
MPGYTPNLKKPDALELFTDRVEEQKTVREVLQPARGDSVKRQHLLTVFYGVGGVGKSTLCRRGCEMATNDFGEEVRVAVTSFDDDRWREGSAFTEVCAELCRCLIERKIVPRLAVALLVLHGQQTGRKGETIGDLDTGWRLAFSALDKGANAANIPGLGLVVDGLKWWREHSHRQALRERIEILGLWPEEQYGKLNIPDLEKKVSKALFLDVVEWLKDNPGLHLRLILDGFERLQSNERREDSQQRLQEFIGCFAGNHEPEACGRFRVLLFGRERLRWDDLYGDPGWNECWTQHMLGGLAEDDAKDFLGKTRTWLRSHGQAALADALARNEDKILDGSDENIGGQRVFYPFYLSLAVDLVERARQRGTEPDLGHAPAELQVRFFRYLDERELRSLKILALSGVFDEALYDWLARERLIDFPVHSFHTELRQEHSYFQKVQGRPGDWRFHRLFEDALHARWQGAEAERAEGIQVVRRLLEFYGGALKTKPERDWTEAEVELWRRGMEIIVTQGPELGLLSMDEWGALRETEPWSADHFRCARYRIDFTRRIIKAQERMLGPGDTRTLDSLNALGILMIETGDYPGGIKLFERVIEGREKALGVEHPDTSESIRNLGLALDDAGEYEQAERLLYRALGGYEKVVGPSHEETRKSAHNLGKLLMNKGDYAGAEAMFRKAVEGNEEVLGQENHFTALSLMGLAWVMCLKKDMVRAEELWRRALDILTRVVGSEHPDTLMCLNNLGLLQKDLGNYETAEQLLRRVLNAREKALGQEHPDTLCSVESLGLLLVDKGDLENGQALLRRAIAGMERVLGSEHPSTLRSVNSLGHLLSKVGKYDSAQVLFQRALTGWEKALGPKHLNTLLSANNLSIALRQQGNLSGALSLLREFAIKSPECLAGVRYNLGCYECLNGNVEEAKRLVAEEIATRAAAREQALKDADLRAIHDFIRSLPVPSEAGDQNPT